MSRSVREELQQDLHCEDLLSCFFGLKALDREVFQVLADTEEALTIDAISDRTDRERSTVYRAVRRLVEAGFVEKEQVNYEEGGYYHVYRPVDPDETSDEMQRLLNDWYAEMGQLIQEFRDTYGERFQAVPATTDE